VPSKVITWKLLLLIFLTDVGDSVGQLFMKKGLAITGIHSVNLANGMDFILQNAATPLVWLGIFFYTIPFFIWIVVLSKVDLSVAMPVGSVSYVIIPVIAVIFLGEHVSFSRWLGIALIVLGIFCVSRSKYQSSLA